MTQELDDKLVDFVEDVSDEVRALRNLLNGNLPTLALLDTAAKTNLVDAINETLDFAHKPISLETLDVIVNDYFVLHPQSFVYDQINPATSILITHPLDHDPVVTFTDSAGSVWYGVVTYPAPNQVYVQFNLPLSGKAVLT